jgi:hypothetical protein
MVSKATKKVVSGMDIIVGLVLRCRGACVNSGGVDTKCFIRALERGLGEAWGVDVKFKQGVTCLIGNLRGY